MNEFHLDHTPLSSTGVVVSSNQNSESHLTNWFSMKINLITKLPAALESEKIAVYCVNTKRKNYGALYIFPSHNKERKNCVFTITTINEQSM